MDTYTRQYVVKSMQDDLLREAREARLAAAARRPSRGSSPSGIGRLVQDLRASLTGSLRPVAHHRYPSERGGQASVTGHMVRPVGA